MKRKKITRDDVLSLLKRRRTGVTAEEVAKALNARPRAVRRHLAGLHAAGQASRLFFYGGEPPVGRYRYTVATRTKKKAAS